MSKKSKQLQKEKRRRIKRARKEARRALYEKYGQEGRLKQKGRSVKKRRKLVNSHPHAIDYCGNPGCRRCHPELNPGPIKKPLVSVSR